MEEATALKPWAELRCLLLQRRWQWDALGPRQVGTRAAATVCEDEQTKLINTSFLKASRSFLRELMFLLN